MTAVMNQLDEELEAKGDPDDPFNGSANGVYQPLPTSLSLPPPVQTLRRQEVSESQEHSRNSQKRDWRTRSVTNTSLNSQHVEPITQVQAARSKSEEHSLESLNPTSGSGIRAKLSTQLQQDGVPLQHEEDTPAQENNVITFTPLPGPGGSQGSREGQQPHEPKGQRTPRRRRTCNGEWDLNQRHFNRSKPQEISHISPVEQANVYNTEEPSVSYLQLPTRRTTDSWLCSKCGNPGHWRKYCQATTWCRFCTSETHSTQACRKYTNFTKDDPIASSRRTTPEQPPRYEQPPRIQPQQGTGITQLFPQPPTQHFQAPVIPPTEGRNIRHPVQRLSHIQRGSQDVRMDPCFQPPPPHYSQIQQHQRIQAPLVEINELGPTIQQGVIQRHVRGNQQNKEIRLSARAVSQNGIDDNSSPTPDPEESERGRSSLHNGKSFSEGYQLALNEVPRPVFVNYYYAGEALVTGMNKRYIRLDECDISLESVAGIQQTQSPNCKSTEHL